MLSGIIGTAGTAVNTSGSNLSIDSDASFAATSGTNIAIGTEAMGGGSLGDCDNNIAVGTNSLTNLSTGDYNIAIGSSAGEAITSNIGNVAIGYKALEDLSNTDGNLGHYNVAIGHEAMFNADDDLCTYNVGIGYNALAGNVSSGGYNTVVGAMAGDSGSNVADNLVIIGAQAGRGDLHANADGTVLIGKSAGAALTEPDANGANIAIGYSAMKVHTTGSRNIAIGYEAMHDTNADSDSMGSNDNVFLGYSAGGGEWGIGESSHNIGIGSYTLNGTLQASVGNIGIGQEALNDLSTGDYNTCIGYNSGDKLTGNSKNVAVGAHTLGDDGANYNVAVGYEAGKACNDDYNVYIGYQAGDVNTGAYNTIIGSAALGNGVDVDKVTVIGQDALTTANNNAANGTVAIGWAAGYYSAPTGDPYTGGNLFIGYAAGTDVSGGVKGLTTGRKNIAIGQESLGANAGGALTANQNTVLGYRAGYSLTGGDPDDNTFIGYRSGYSATTGTDNTLIGSDTALSAVGGDGQIAIGKGVTCIADNTITVGIGSNTASLGLEGTDTSWAAASSDERLKENIKSCDVGLAFINDLRPVTYNWKKAKDVPKDMPQYMEGSEKPVLGFDYGVELHGFIAQEVKEAIDKHDGIKDSFKMWQLKDDGTQTVADGAVIPMLIKAIQELSQQIEDLKKG